MSELKGKMVDGTCEYCGSNFTYYEPQDQSFCSRECWKSSTEYNFYTCEECGVEFKEYASGYDRTYCSVECYEKNRGKSFASHKLESSRGYECWLHENRKVRVHQLVAIAKGYDPDKVFSPEYSVDHINGCKIDNHHENIQLLTISEHSEKDAQKRGKTYSHTELLTIISAVLEDGIEEVLDGQGSKLEPDF